tara:strand:+ start:154 stop:723 length:570 start_codon:yes stop_codon:yes gene_type:complete
MLRFFSLLIYIILLSTNLFSATESGEPSALMDFIWKTLNVLVLVAIIYKFAKKPLTSALSNNAKSAKKLIDEARDSEEKISKNLIEMKSKISSLEEEAIEMVENAKKTAEKEKNRIIEEGKREIKRMTEQANFALKQERIKAEDELKNWIAEESVKLAEIKIKNQMNQNHQKNLVSDYMDQLKNQKELF